ncbi:MAG: hypothetical protein GKR89_05945 [Candidatus Latescibacteria bacterium]|nr:hypothetical protein [Candidatus Latescibacterota bacterium]
MRKLPLGLIFVFMLGLLLAFVIGARALTPPTALEAFDTPSDAGGSITLTWPRAADAPVGTTYLIWVALSPEGPFHPAAEISAVGNIMANEPALFGHDDANENFHFAHINGYTPAGAEASTELDNETTYYLRLDVKTGTQIQAGTGVAQARSTENLFNRPKLNNFILGTLFSIVILGYIAVARRRELSIRRIAGLEALDEALGRATEMGKPVLFAHGLTSMDSPSTIASINILGRVARRTAAFDTMLKVANNDPIVMSVSQEVVKEAYLEAGRPDAFNPDNVFMVATDQFSYAAAVEGIMVRERPAANIMMGYFYAESLLLAETGASTGAIQIAGTDSYTQLPFFVTTCDYTLMGEELYAASAYLSREPRLLGSLKGQDVGKAIFIGALVLGTLLATFDLPQLTYVFTAY